MRDELMSRISMALISEGFDADKVHGKLVLILNDYEIQSRCTEIAITDEDDIPKYIRLFLISKRVAGRTDRTIYAYESELKRFFYNVRKSPLDGTSDDIRMYLAVKEVKDGAGKVYLKHISRVLSSFYQWMQKEEYLLKNPMNKVEDIKTPKVKKKAFTETEIEQLRLASDGNIRLQCVFELLLSTWCRVSEIAQMKIKDIAENKESVLVHGKGEKDRTCYINARAKIYLQRYLDCRKDDNEYLFPSCKIGVNDGDKVFSTECKKQKVNPKDWWMAETLVGDNHVDKGVIESMIRKLVKNAGVEKTHPHRFRRTGATFALKRGMPIEQVSKLLGHESIETTQIYLDLGESELQQGHKKFVD